MHDAGELIKRLRKIFHDVTLEDGGVSLGEAIVLDNYGSMEDRIKARSKDELADWKQLVGSKDLISSIGGGALSFVDARGMRFYLPACFETLLQCENPDDRPEIYRRILFHLGDWDSDFELLNQPQILLIYDILNYWKARTDQVLMIDLNAAIASTQRNLQWKS